MMIVQRLLTHFAFLFAMFLSCNLLAPSALAEDFFVSPAGNDQNAGTLESPLASIAAAQTKVRAFKQKTPNEPVTVYLRAGKYYLTQPVLFTPEDSGTADGPVVYKAYQDEIPQVLGGVKLTDLKWEQTKDNVYKTKVPEGLVFETLFINGQQQILARYPNYTERRARVQRRCSGRSVQRTSRDLGRPYLRLLPRDAPRALGRHSLPDHWEKE